MISPHKIILFCVSLTFAIAVFVEAGDSSDDGSALALLLAAGLITALLKNGVASARNSYSLGRHGSKLILPLNHLLGIEKFANHHGLDRLRLQNYAFNPGFGNFRNNLGGLEEFPMQPMQLDPSFEADIFRRKDFKPRGMYPPLPDMISNKGNRFDEDFDPVQNILRREREGSMPILNRSENDPSLKSENPEYFGYNPEGKPSARRNQ